MYVFSAVFLFPPRCLNYRSPQCRDPVSAANGSRCSRTWHPLLWSRKEHGATTVPHCLQNNTNKNTAMHCGIDEAPARALGLATPEAVRTLAASLVNTSYFPVVAGRFFALRHSRPRPNERWIQFPLIPAGLLRVHRRSGRKLCWRHYCVNISFGGWKKVIGFDLKFDFFAAVSGRIDISVTCRGFLSGVDKARRRQTLKLRNFTLNGEGTRFRISVNNKKYSLLG